MSGLDATTPRGHRIGWGHWSALVGIYLATRLAALDRLPVYVDESVHLFWGRETIAGSLAAGMWNSKWLPIKIFAVASLFPLPILLAGRAAAVATGLGALAACVLIGRQLFGSRSGAFAGWCYVVLPYALFFDRLALADVFLTAFGAWTLLLSIEVARRPAWTSAAWLTVALWAAMLSKLSGALFLVFPLLAIATLVPRQHWRPSLARALPSVGCGVMMLALLIWRAAGIDQATDYTSFDVATLAGENLWRTIGWYRELLTPPISIVVLAGSVWMLAAYKGERRRGAVLVVCVFLVTCVPYVLAARIWFTRYLLPTIVPIALMAGLTLGAATSRQRPTNRLFLRRTCAAGLWALVVIPAIATDLRIILWPDSPRMPESLRQEYVAGPGSGYGLLELRDFLRSQAVTGEIQVARFFFWAPPYTGLDVYLSPVDRQHLRMHTINPFLPGAAAGVQALPRSGRTFFVSHPEGEASELEARGLATRQYLGDATVIWERVKPGGRTRLVVWELHAPGP